MTDAEKRRFVANMYPGPRWAARVRKMSDAQVYAIYIQKQKYDEEHKHDKKEDTEDEIPF